MLQGSGRAALDTGPYSLTSCGPIGERGEDAARAALALQPSFTGCDVPVATSTVYNQTSRRGGFSSFGANKNEAVLGWLEKGGPGTLLTSGQHRTGPTPANTSLGRS